MDIMIHTRSGTSSTNSDMHRVVVIVILLIMIGNEMYYDMI